MDLLGIMISKASYGIIAHANNFLWSKPINFPLIERVQSNFYLNLTTKPHFIAIYENSTSAHNSFLALSLSFIFNAFFAWFPQQKKSSVKAQICNLKRCWNFPHFIFSLQFF